MLLGVNRGAVVVQRVAPWGWRAVRGVTIAAKNLGPSKETLQFMEDLERGRQPYLAHVAHTKAGKARNCPFLQKHDELLVRARERWEGEEVGKVG